ncbi:E3 ubiquitin-protein ligase Praja-2-like [Bacillus rossius redtenbacheri]|uniref:E3 ubiquitin-protein ligase Praja-2-like n=1 Tax=Bacillus rossius redtenbacheri TaxID=93214 RepID=UPI002FDDD1E5
MEGDYDYIYSDAHEDLNYSDGHVDYGDEDLFCDDVDILPDEVHDIDTWVSYYDERDYMSGESGGEDADDWPEEGDAVDQPHDGNNENMWEELGEVGVFEGSNDSLLGSEVGCSVEGENCELDSGEEGCLWDDDEYPLHPRSDGIVEDAVEGLSEEGENDENQSNHSGESDGEAFMDAQNGNEGDEPEYDEYEDMDEELEGEEDEIWDTNLVPPWQADDTWDDIMGVGDEWYDYYDGDEVWVDNADGRFELRYEDYTGEALDEDAPVRDNFVTRTTAVEAGSVQDPVPAGGTANYSCPICLERIEAQEVGNPWNCHHFFCLDCILEWVCRSNTCPVDRKVVGKIAVRCRLGSPVTRVVSVVPVALAGGED